MQRERVVPLVSTRDLERVVPGARIVLLVLCGVSELREWTNEIESIDGSRIMVARSLKTVHSQEWICRVVVIADFVPAAQNRITWSIRGRTLMVGIVTTAPIFTTTSGYLRL